ncbi:dsrm domain protein [Rhizoctonia solani]|uniref:Dsrm domain protein n=1 Tax=Rhizoctonia solani TaxID=456999 RepID=A0A8H8T0C7_9AGAM|nr:dsrm domain protein [Rhizoctonia solani]QRW25256.1 dsrm domain protein [Rhizoctonia solani]
MTRFYTRIYTPSRTSGYRDQLNVWSDRVHIGHIQFTTQGFYHQTDQMQYQAIPFSPKLSTMATDTKHMANPIWMRRDCPYRASPKTDFPLIPALSYLTISPMYLVRVLLFFYPTVIMYGAEESLVDPYVIGWGTSKRKAEENAAEKLLTSRRYCFY